MTNKHCRTIFFKSHDPYDSDLDNNVKNMNYRAPGLLSLQQALYDRSK